MKKFLYMSWNVTLLTEIENPRRGSRLKISLIRSRKAGKGDSC